MAGRGADGARRPIASRARRVRSRRRRGVSARSSRNRRGLHRQGCPRRELLWRYRGFRGPAGARGERRPLSRRGGRAGGRRQRDDARSRPCDVSRDLEPAARAHDARRGARRGRRTHSSAPRRQHPDDRTRGARRCRCGPRRGGRRGRRRFRDRFRRARLHRARGGLCSPCRRPHRGPGLHAGALYGSRRRREDPRASRPSRCGSSRPRSAAALARSSICRFSLSSQSPPGCSIGPSAWSIRAANRS